MSEALAYIIIIAVTNPTKAAQPVLRFKMLQMTLTGLIASRAKKITAKQKARRIRTSRGVGERVSMSQLMRRASSASSASAAVVEYSSSARGELSPSSTQPKTKQAELQFTKRVASITSNLDQTLLEAHLNTISHKHSTRSPLHFNEYLLDSCNIGFLDHLT